MYRKFKICDGCYFQDRAPEICEGCKNGNKFESAELDTEALDDLRDELGGGRFQDSDL